MCSNLEYRRRLVTHCHERLTQLHAEAGLVLDLKDPLAFRLAANAAGETEARAALCQAQRRRGLAVLCVGIPRAMARAMAARAPEALAHFERMGRGLLPVIVISTGGCSVAGVPKDRLRPGLN